MDQIKLALGCGRRNYGKDWIHIDKANFDHIVGSDVFCKDYPIKSVDVIYACHLIAYFTLPEFKELLKSWERVLKSGGILRIATPDLRRIAVMLTDPFQNYELETFTGPIYGNWVMDGQMISHKNGYDFWSLKRVLEEAGFTGVVPYDWKKTEHAHVDDHSMAYIPHMAKDTGTLISLNVECNA